MASGRAGNARRSSHSNLRGPRAFSLVEVLVATGLVTIVIGGIYGVTVFGRRTTSTSMVHADCAAREAQVLGTITKAMSQCRNILCPADGGFSDYLLFETQSGAHHLLRLAPGRRHLLLTVVERNEHYVLADTKDSPLSFSRLTFQRFGDEVDMSLSFRNLDAEEFKLFSHAYTGLAVNHDGLR